MSLTILPLLRKSFPAEGVQVTKENIVDVAAWCHGELRSKVLEDRVVPFIKVEVNNPISDKQTEAFIGDWVIKVGHGFKVFTIHSFNRSFEVDENPQELHKDTPLDGIAL